MIPLSDSAHPARRFPFWLQLTNTNTGSVAYFAHIGGFVSGFILAKLYGTASTPQQLKKIN